MRRTLLATIAALLLCILTVAALPFVWGVVRDTPRIRYVENDFRQIRIALQSYCDSHGRFPPAYVTDENGRPMHSWRVLILREIGRHDLYERYDFEQPWDTPLNLAVMQQAHCYFDRRLVTEDLTLTPYQLLVEPGSAFDPLAAPPDRSGFQDAWADKVILIENLGNPVPWTKPEDLSRGGLVERSLFQEALPKKIVVLMGDGSVKVVTEAELRALLPESPFLGTPID